VLLVTVLLTWPAVASALPQYGVMASRMCSNCHIAPVGWEDPDVSERKCSLNCNTCHINQTGGGLRTTSGNFYGYEIVPMIGTRPGDTPIPPKPKPEGWTPPPPPASQPASRPASQPAGLLAPSWVSDVNIDMFPALTLIGDVDPAKIAEEEFLYPIPEAGTKERFGGMDPFPYYSVGGDIRSMVYLPLDSVSDDWAIFPMQLDLHAAGVPYNPQKYNEGRLTLYMTMGFEGDRGDGYDGFWERFYMKEWMALFHDLPYQMYAKLGRFTPAFGWRIDDHTAYTRQIQWMGDCFPFNDPDRRCWEQQVTGLEVGLNPNYLYANVSVFNPANDWADPFEVDDHFGTAVNVGYRDLLWQLGASFMFEDRSDAQEAWGSLQWSLNFHSATHNWKGLDLVPLIYLGEATYRFMDEGAAETHSLALMNELDWWVMDGLNVEVRHDYLDPNLDVDDDQLHRLSVGVRYHVYTWISMMVFYRHNHEATDEFNDEVLVQLHAWY